MAPSRSSSVADGPRVALLGHLALHPGQDAADRDDLRVRPVACPWPRLGLVGHQVGERAVALPGEDVLDAEQRVVGDVEPEHLALEGQQRRSCPTPPAGTRHVEGRLAPSVVAEAPNRRVLPDRLVALDVDRPRRRPARAPSTRPLRGVAERVERARLDQRLDGPLVADHRGHLAQEVGEAGERALRLAGRDDRLDHVVADVADRGQAEPDVRADRRRSRRPTR